MNVAHMQDVKQGLISCVQERMDYVKDYADEEVMELIDDVLLEREEISLCPVDYRRMLRQELFNSLRGLDILQSFVEDPTVTEIMINGTEPIFVEQKGVLRQLETRFDSVERLQDVIQRIVAGCNCSVS